MPANSATPAYGVGHAERSRPRNEVPRRPAVQGLRRERHWKRWGPYLAERQWGTVREDYSEHGECWSYFPHDHARSRAYRWGEDGLLGISDRIYVMNDGRFVAEMPAKEASQEKIMALILKNESKVA